MSVNDALFGLYGNFKKVTLRLPYGKCRRKWVKVSDLVVVHEEKVKRGYWKLTHVVEILPSRDGSVRKVKISIPCFNDKGKAASPTILERSVQQFCPLELAGGDEEEDHTQIDPPPSPPIESTEENDKENGAEI